MQHIGHLNRPQDAVVWTARVHELAVGRVE